MNGKSRCRPLCCICYYCNCTASAVLWCCCWFTLIIQVCSVFGLGRFTAVIRSTYVTHKIYLRKTTVLEKNASRFLNTYTHFSRIVSAERFFPFYVYKVDYNSRRLFFSYHVYFIKEVSIAHFPDI